MTSWTLEEKEIVKDCKEKRYSASETARFLVGRTRNSVIGQWRDLGLSSPLPPRKLKVEREPYVRWKRPPPEYFCPQEELAEDKMQDPPQQEPVRFEDLKRDMCKWPVNDPGIKEFFLFCGLPKEEFAKYCPHHTRMAHKPLHGRRVTTPIY